MKARIFSKIKNVLKKFKPKQKDMTYEEFINLEGKKFPSSEAKDLQSKTKLYELLRSHH